MTDERGRWSLRNGSVAADAWRPVQVGGAGCNMARAGARLSTNGDNRGQAGHVSQRRPERTHGRSAT